MKRLISLCLLVLIPLTALAAAEPEKPKGGMTAENLSGLQLRGIGPAVASGRVSDIAVSPADPYTWFVTAASGGVWKTTNAGTTFTPVFDDQGSYSIGCVTIDPHDPLVVWIGTGENNSQRSVGYGDGVYKSVDGGKSWENLGLKSSEHIAKIVIDPRSSQTVFVAAQGPLWAPGGDRGLYKSVDGGKTWKKALQISENTGVTDLVYDPRNPDVMWAAAYQRRRHVWTLIDGGPESAIYKSRDGGETWAKVTKGLPKEDIGRIGLAISPADPNILYAVIEAANKTSGFFRSTDGGSSWEKRSGYNPTSPQYYQELFADPKNPDRVYSMDTYMKVSEDGGKTFRDVGEVAKHVDNHALWIDGRDTDHLLAGCDGGLYESWDRGATWKYFSNLPLAQFYKLSIDNSRPFYYVYGGTQDNNTLGGPIRTLSAHGITNADWFVTTGGDGFQPRADPEDPNIVYSEAQYGALIRYDRKTGETVDVKPQPGKGEPPLRWNWDSPLIISPHSHTRLYFGANRLFRSDDRGNTWRPISPDLTRQLDRNKMKIMGRVWPIEAVAKNASTSFYGNIVSLTESPLKENRIYTGTDDGLIQVTDDSGEHWTRIDKVPGVPDLAYVSRLDASQHGADVVYAAFDNHKMGDFKPYLYRSSDRGKSWTSISGDLPARGSVYAFAEDPVKPDLLFAGTEFGLFFTVDGGKKWVQLKGGLPVIAVCDIAIQKRENDLVIATFGRGFFVLDDYTPLRLLTPQTLQANALFPVRNALLFVPAEPLGLRTQKAFQGDAFYSADNPPLGATFTYYLLDKIRSLREVRREKEKELVKDNKDLEYPSWEVLRQEAREEDPRAVLTVSDPEGNVVRRVTGPVEAGFHRVAWDLRYPAPNPTELKESEMSVFAPPPRGPLAAPGKYSVSLSTVVDGKTTEIGGPQGFEIVPLGLASLPPADNAAVLDFEQKTARLQRAVLGAIKSVDEAQTRINYLRKALVDTPAGTPQLTEQLRVLDQRLKDMAVKLTGDEVVARYNEPTPPSIADRVETIVEGEWATTGAPTATQLEAYRIASDEFAPLLNDLRQLIEVDLKNFEDQAEKAGAPWTPGRVPRWQPE